MGYFKDISEFKKQFSTLHSSTLIETFMRERLFKDTGF